ncbi:MAG: MBL fold metallo-hydrolase, partial [Chloroflexi bacterium]|nr:MBL fold metallo-hydrolase [Chloroflexota bacterium]
FRRDDLRLRITAVPAQHTPLRLMQPLLPRTMGSVLSFSQVQTEEQLLRMYVSGDTLMHDDLREIPRQFPDIDVGLFHVGGTRIFGVMLTMDADQAVQAIQVVAPRVAVPIHYDDYDVFKSPLADLQRAVQAAGLTDRVRYVDRGESVPLAARSV